MTVRNKKRGSSESDPLFSGETSKMECRICPRECGSDRKNGVLGKCRCGDGMIVSLVGLHKGEEPCISGKNGAGTIFFAGCSLGCVFCQNSEISRTPRGRIYSESELIDAIKSLEDRGAENIEFVTATHYSEQIRSVLEKYKPSVPVVWNSSGYEKVETLGLFDGLIDVYLPDLKFFSSDLSRRYAACPDYFEKAFSAIREMRRQTGGCVFDGDGKLLRGTLIRHLVLPSHIHDSFEILKRIAEDLPRDICVSLLCQYFPTEELKKKNKYPELLRKLKRKEYSAVIDRFLALGLENGFVQELSSATEKYVPVWDI